jgi:peroxiredoxin
MLASTLVRTLLVVVFVALAAPRGAAAESRLGAKIDDFTLRDYRGREHALSELAASRVVVVAFVGVECPLAKLYAPRLEELRQEFSPRGVAFVGIDSNRQDSLAELAAFARVHGI